MPMPCSPRSVLAAASLLVCLAASGRADAQALSFYNLSPCRAVDTRNGSGGILPGATERKLQIRGVCGVPADAKTVTVNVTAVGPTHEGYLVLWPTGGNFPVVSNLNFNDGEPAIANAAVVPLGSGSPDLSVAYGAKFGGADRTHVVVDVTGYFK